jgi:hypothetical protein
MTKFLALLTCLVILTGCATPVQRQLATVVAQASTPIASTPTPLTAASSLPSKEETANWMLITDELEYIRYFRYLTSGYFGDRLPGFFVLADQARRDPQAMRSNKWRADMALKAVGLDELGMFFGSDNPSERFAPIIAKVDEIKGHFAKASRLTNQAINENDATLLDLAGSEIQAAQQAADEIEVVFTALVGPPEN